eukprot:5211353-Amphidinium_carterae.1
MLRMSIEKVSPSGTDVAAMHVVAISYAHGCPCVSGKGLCRCEAHNDVTTCLVPMSTSMCWRFECAGAAPKHWHEIGARQLKLVSMRQERTVSLTWIQLGGQGFARKLKRRGRASVCKCHRGRRI